MGQAELKLPRARRVDSPNCVSKNEKLTNIPNLTELTYRCIKEQLLDGTLSEGTRLTKWPRASSGPGRSWRLAIGADCTPDGRDLSVPNRNITEAR
jgi:hypothetical protein